MSTLDINQIRDLIPQRYPFLMIDRIIEIETKVKAVALKNVSVNEPCFQGHFPDYPIFPGVFIVEAMAQATIIFFIYGDKAIEESEKSFILSSVKSRFLQPVYPGDQMRLEVTPKRLISNGGIVKVITKVEDRIVCKGEIGFSIQDKWV